MDREELRRAVAGIRWFHSIDLGDGIVTQGVSRTSRLLGRLQLPADLSGLSVLDVGTFDGFYAFEAERRGATSVVATDTVVWRHPDIGRAGFDLARAALGSSVQDREVEVGDLSPETVGMFDLVLFLGVLYHLKDPLGALERVASVTRRQVVVETHVDLLSIRQPAAALYPGDELHGDPSNWWGPNLAAVIGMLSAVGFSRVDVVYVSPRRSRMALAVKRRLGGKPLRRSIQQGRAVLHAFKPGY